MGILLALTISTCVLFYDSFYFFFYFVYRKLHVHHGHLSVLHLKQLLFITVNAIFVNGHE